VTKITLPNVRKLFVPDNGFTLFEADLAGADAQVVAWEADDLDLKSAFRSGLAVHIKNVRDVFPEKVRGWSDEAIKATDRPGGIYYNNKRGVHGTNYGAAARTIAIATNRLVSEAERFQRRWLGLHPGIRTNFQETVQAALQQNRTVANRFGFRRIFFDRPDACYTEALAWIPQSTVALNTYLGALQLEERLPDVQILLQVHDSLVFQLPSSLVARTLPLLPEYLTITTPYLDPLRIPWTLSMSVKSWGECEKVKLPSTS
jgi:DNA polymerase-1